MLFPPEAIYSSFLWKITKKPNKQTDKKNPKKHQQQNKTKKKNNPCLFCNQPYQKRS